MKRGKEHPVIAFGLKLREVFLDLGFDEIINPMIVDEREVYLQYGKEAPLILDRVFYLAGLDRTDIGLSREKLLKVREIIPSFSKEEELKAFLRSFKEGKIEGDDFLEEMVKALSISKEEAVEIVDKVFTEFRELKPIPSGKTLRSHMTANWFGALSHLKNRRPLPIKLFSIGPRFRREQRQDAHHLYESTSASLVVADSNFTLSDGQELTTEILKRVGFPSLEFKKKEVFSNYYEAETDTEIMINLKGEEIEIAN
ncbi:O-phosphoserine--tRNA ligase, partial [bacterium]|nr:O-phosphoserine--tRNA ligase [bacterium]